MLKTQDFSKTGIKGTHITWEHDVKPMAESLAKEGLVHKVTRKQEEGRRRAIYRIFNTIGGEVEEFFNTSQLAVVWMYLLGLASGQFRTELKHTVVEKRLRKERDEALEAYVLENQEPDPMTMSMDYVKIPSKKYLLQVFTGMAHGGDKERCRKEWADMLELVGAFRKAGRLAVTACFTIDQTLADIQTAFYLEGENNIGIMLNSLGEI